MRFRGLNLNLLIALKVLLQERSVSRAALRLNISQPAASAALAQLRNYFDDDLLVASGRRMLPTAHAEIMIAQLDEVMVAIDRLILSTALFDPATSNRCFRIIASDYITTVLFTPLIPQIQRIAPGVTLEFLLPNAALEVLDRGEVDLLLTLEDLRSLDHPSEFLLEETHVAVGCAENPALHGALTEDLFFELGHVGVALNGRSASTFAETEMAKLGRRRRIEITAPTFSMVPSLLPKTSRIAVMHARLAHLFAATLPIRIARMPFPFPVMREVAQYHPTREHDAGMRWLLDLIKRQASATT